MGSCDVGDGSTRSDGAGFRVTRVGTVSGPVGFAVKRARLSLVFGDIPGATGGADALEFRPAWLSPSSGRTFREVEIVGFGAVEAVADFRATFRAGAAAFAPPFALTGFFTRTVRLFATPDCR